MPLLLLSLVGWARTGHAPEFRFAEVSEALDPLLREFGPKNLTSAHYPFWHLSNNAARIWTIPEAGELSPGKSNSRPSLSEFRLRDPRGTVPEVAWRELATNEALRGEIVQQLLVEFWPETLHRDIRARIELDDSRSAPARVIREVAARDQAFRIAVLTAYGHACAVCGFDARLAGRFFGIDAAHIVWHCLGGADAVENGLALCPTHHRGFDGGVIGIDPEYRILVSGAIAGGQEVDAAFRRFAAMPIRAGDEARPAQAHLKWHREEVFRP